jgi:hypothetical protein
MSHQTYIHVHGFIRTGSSRGSGFKATTIIAMAASVVYVVMGQYPIPVTDDYF